MNKARQFVLASSVLALISCGGQSEDPSSSSSAASSVSSVITQPPEPIPGDINHGLTLYQQQCEVCHGENGEGVSQLNSPPLVNCSICDNPETLSRYIEVAMPPGGASVSCEGDCAVDVSAYVISRFNSGPDLSSCGDATPSPSVFKRLSRLEYAYTMQDLMGLSELPDVSQIPDDPSVHNFKTIAKVQAVQASHLDGYFATATALANSLMDSASRRSAVLGCNYTDGGCLSTFVHSFGRLAFRRPLENAEATRIIQFATSNGESSRDQFVLAMQLLLTSPNFIYRVEVGNSAEGLSTLNDYELAARLSFALWGRGPNQELMDRAAAGELRSAGGLKSVAQWMLQDVRARENMSAFFEQWLATNLLKEPVEKPFDWYDGILDDMRAETNSLLGEYVWQNKDFMGVLTENRTYLTPGLARYYGLAQPESASEAVNLPSNHPRAQTGILTHVSNMLAKTDGDLVAMRGNWLRKTFLCKELQLPNGVAAIINGKFAGLSPLEIIHERNIDESCERCHAQIDPIGVAFSPFARDGLYDPLIQISDFPIDPGFPDANDASIDSVQGIAKALAEMPEVGQCLADRLFLYTRNHEPESDDHCAVNQASQSFNRSGNQFASLLLSLVEDPSFRVRQVPEPYQPPEEEATVENLALGKSVSTSNAQDGQPGSLITDGDLQGGSRWSAQYFPQNATVDLGRVYKVVQIEVYPYSDRAYRYTVEASRDGVNFSQIVNRSRNNDSENVLIDLVAPTDARYIRVNVTGVVGYDGDWISLRELKVYGSAN